MSKIRVVSVVLIAIALAVPPAVSSQTVPAGAGPVGGMSAAALLAPSPTPSALLPAGWPEQRLFDDAPEPLAALPQAQARNPRGVRYMLVGGALFLAGVIVGDDVGTLLALGGVGVAVYGAYVYFGY